VNASLLLPDARATELLVATLRSGDVARDAWSRWTHGCVDSVARALGDDAVLARPLLPLLHESVRRNDLPIDAETATYLRSARLTESLRSRAYREIVNDLTTSLRDAGVPFLLVKGAAVGELFYDEPAFRHAHDVELVVHDRRAVRAALAGSRFRIAKRDFVHESGLPLRVHRRLFVPRMRFDERELWDAAVTLPNGARTPEPAHALAVTLVLAGRSLSRQSGRWICDADAIVRGAGIDWPRFIDVVTRAGASIAASAQLQLLRKTFAVDVPLHVIETVRDRAAHASVLERAVASAGAHAGNAPLPVRFVRQLLRIAARA
jgi:hypothetical protein